MSSATNLLGEFECRIDEKSRIIFPSKLKKQIPPSAEGKFTIINGIEPCLVIYPQNEWNLIVEKINRLDFFKTENRVFVHYYYRGLFSTALDSQGRLLLPKSQFAYAGIDKDVFLFAYSTCIEIWDKEKYTQMINTQPFDFAKMAERVMGQNNQTNYPDDVS